MSSIFYLRKLGLTNELFSDRDIISVEKFEVHTYCSSFKCANETNNKKGKKVHEGQKRPKVCPVCKSSTFLFYEKVTKERPYRGWRKGTDKDVKEIDSD